MFVGQYGQASVDLRWRQTYTFEKVSNFAYGLRSPQHKWNVLLTDCIVCDWRN